MAEQVGHQLTEDTGSEPVFDFYCEFCREDGKMLEAGGYCVDCGEYLCDTCYTCHRRSRGNRYHVLMDKNEMPKDTPLSLDLVSKDISRKCEQHTSKLVEYYCKSHDLLGCSICIFEGHKSCSGVESITNRAESIIDSQEYKEFIEMLNQCDQRARDNIKLVQDNLDQSKTSWREVAKSLKQFREEINSMLDELEKSILKQAEDLQREKEQTLINVSGNLKTSLESTEKIMQEFDDLQKSRKVCDIYIRLKETKKGVTDIQTELDKAERENVVREYTFEPNTVLKDCLWSQHGLGKLSVFSVIGSVSAVATSPSHSNLVNTKATHVIDIDVTSSKDKKKCWITGSAVVSNNRLIIVDHNNDKVKLIDTQSNAVISELKVSGYPWDVTVIGRNQAAVTVYNKEKILLLNVSDTLKLDKEITVGGGCYGVAYSKDRLVVTYTDPGKLEIMGLSGKVMKTVKNDRDGNKLFSKPIYVCVSNDGETIYVSDLSGNKVFCLNFNGEVQSVYSDSELKYPEKVCVDKEDNVLVCFYSGTVLMLTANLNKIKIILTPTDGLDSRVYSVSHCQETNKLYVGMQYNNKVKVYQLSQ